jgi:CRP/FNR family transcriptional regulator, cyclic AMP receptor protein
LITTRSKKALGHSSRRVRDTPGSTHHGVDQQTGSTHNAAPISPTARKRLYTPPMALGMRKDSKIALIKKVPLFAPLTNAQLGQIASIADEVGLPEGKKLTRQGERGREFFILLDGEADVRRSGRKVATIRPGDFFGELALVSDRPRTATVTATEPVRVLVIRDVEFRSVLLRPPQPR